MVEVVQLLEPLRLGLCFTLTFDSPCLEGDLDGLSKCCEGSGLLVRPASRSDAKETEGRVSEKHDEKS